MKCPRESRPCGEGYEAGRKSPQIRTTTALPPLWCGLRPGVLSDIGRGEFYGTTNAYPNYTTLTRYFNKDVYLYCRVIDADAYEHQQETIRELVRQVRTRGTLIRFEDICEALTAIENAVLP